MDLFIGADHGGATHKDFLVEALLNKSGLRITDLSPAEPTPSDDYPPVALKLSESVLENEGSFGILLCRSGQGMCMAANKVPGIRAALVWDEQGARETREDNDANVVCLPADRLSPEDCLKCVDAFLSTPFSNEERHVRRLTELREIEGREYAG